MDDRIPGHDAAQLAVGQVQRVHRTDLEPQARVRLAGKADHHRGQVDAEGVQPQAPQVRREVSGAASQLCDRPGIVRPRELGEGGEQRTVQGEDVEAVTGEVGVDNGHGVVGIRCRAEVRG